MNWKGEEWEQKDHLEVSLTIHTKDYVPLDYEGSGIEHGESGNLEAGIT